MNEFVIAMTAGFAGASIYGLLMLIQLSVRQRREQRRAELFYEKIGAFRDALFDVPPVSWRTKDEGRSL